MAYSKSQKWYYLSSQCPDEILLIKCFDSKESIPAMCQSAVVPICIWNSDYI